MIKVKSLFEISHFILLLAFLRVWIFSKRKNVCQTYMWKLVLIFFIHASLIVNEIEHLFIHLLIIPFTFLVNLNNFSWFYLAVCLYFIGLSKFYHVLDAAALLVCYVSSFTPHVMGSLWSRSLWICKSDFIFNNFPLTLLFLTLLLNGGSVYNILSRPYNFWLLESLIFLIKETVLFILFCLVLAF